MTEAATSAFVQANYLVCALSGVQAFADLNLSPTDLGFLAASISLSCGMLGLGFASRDKSPSRVLGLPGKKTNWDLEFLMLILVRSMEVLSRVFGTSLVHISTRFANFKLGGPVMILAMAFSSRLLFRNATAVDAMAAVVAHPGQLLEPTSLLPFHVSLLLDGMLALTLIICQILVRYEALFAEHSKAGGASHRSVCSMSAVRIMLRPVASCCIMGPGSAKRGVGSLAGSHSCQLRRKVIFCVLPGGQGGARQVLFWILLVSFGFSKLKV